MHIHIHTNLTPLQYTQEHANIYLHYIHADRHKHTHVHTCLYIHPFIHAGIHNTHTSGCTHRDT